VLGECQGLGEMQTPQKMNLTLKKDPFSKILEKFWEIEFYVNSQKKNIRLNLFIFMREIKGFLRK
jgi:hypothetical protein